MTKKNLIMLLLLAVSFFGYSQTAAKKEFPKDPLPKEERYKKLKELHIKELDSKTHFAMDSLFQVFAYKITPDVELNEMKVQGSDYLSWVKDNLSKTEFKDFAEAEKLWNEYQEATTVNIAANKEYYDYLIQTIQVEGGVDISVKVTSDVWEEYPEKLKRIKLPKRKKKKDFYPKMPGQ